MAVIFKLKLKKFKSVIIADRGFVLVTSIFIMVLILSLALYAASFTLTERRIASSQKTSVQTYYLAESGVAEAIWKIKNDPIWKKSFEENATWSTSTNRASVLYPNGSYTIAIQNTDLAKGEITVTANLNLGLNSSRRIIKTSVYKALGTSTVDGIGEFSSNNMTLSGSHLNVFNGGIFCNSNLTIMHHSDVHVAGPAEAVRNLTVNSGGSLTASSTRDMHSHPPPETIPMPAISFDNAGDPNSYKARADQVYSATQFSNLLWANQGHTLTLTGITYVTGAISFKGHANIIINGILVADGAITIGEETHNCCWGSFCGEYHHHDKEEDDHNDIDGGVNVTTTKTGVNEPAGIISKTYITFESCLNSFSADGLIYGNSGLTINDLPHKIFVNGALISNDLSMSSDWAGVDLTVDNTTVNSSLGDPQFSPIVTVDHWEEEY